MNWTSRSARTVRSARFEQGLLRADVERRDLGDAVDQHLVVEPRHRFPFDHIAERVGIAPRLALDLGALCDAEHLVRLFLEAAAVGIDLAVGRVDLGLPRDPEPAEALQHDVEAAVVKLVAAGDSADAADLEQSGRLLADPCGWIIAISRSLASASRIIAR